MLALCSLYWPVYSQGFSLGAHVAGNAGSATTSGKLSRVTGLDPAMPGFHVFASEKTRLDPTDAVFVDVIHSCAGVLGFLQPLGKVDFYPNGGTAVQPGCCCISEVMGKVFRWFFQLVQLSLGKTVERFDLFRSFQRLAVTDERTYTLQKASIRRRVCRL